MFQGFRPKVVLATLPHPSRLALNVPLAAGYLKGAAYASGLLDEVDIDILSPEVAAYYGCRMLVDKIVALKPAILGFTLYLWNLERSLHIAKEVKAKLPGVQIIVGGPEVSTTAIHLFSTRDIDIAVHGEGEITFIELLKSFLHEEPELSKIPGLSYRENNGVVFTGPRVEVPDVEVLPSPYLMGYLNPGQYAQMPIFTTRGCIQGCTYCSWSGRGRLRPFSLDRIRSELLLARKAEGTIRVGIFDSAFNASPRFAEVCQMIQEINADRHLRFTCFLLADLVNDETARLLRAANFAHVEVGLQSSNPAVLSNIGRGSDLTKLVKGVRILEREGLRVKVDTILGLPGDSPESFEDTMRFCRENSLNFQICNLSLGYGTVLRRRQDQFGLKIQPRPPYFVYETATFPRDHLENARGRYLERCLDLHRLFDLAYPVLASIPLTPFSDGCKDDLSTLQDTAYPIRNIVLKMNGPPSLSSRASSLAKLISRKVESKITLLYAGGTDGLHESRWFIEELLTQLYTQNPYLMCDVLLETEGHAAVQEVAEEIASLLQTPAQFLDRRDEIFPAQLPFALRKRTNIFAVVKGDCEPDVPLDASRCIRAISISGSKAVLPQLEEILTARERGLLIEFDDRCDLKVVNEVMEQLALADKNVYFKDWAWQSIWEENFINFPSSNQNHYEVAIDQNFNFVGRFFDDNELWLLKLMRRAGQGGITREIALGR